MVRLVLLPLRVITMPLMSQTRIGMALNFDFDILAFLILADPEFLGEWITAQFQQGVFISRSFQLSNAAFIPPFLTESEESCFGLKAFEKLNRHLENYEKSYCGQNQKTIDSMMKMHAWDKVVEQKLLQRIKSHNLSCRASAQTSILK